MLFDRKRENLSSVLRSNGKLWKMQALALEDLGTIAS